MRPFTFPYEGVLFMDIGVLISATSARGNVDPDGFAVDAELLAMPEEPERWDGLS